MPARHAILGLLMQQPLHGYDIDGIFEQGLRRFCHVNISQIYAYLKSMEERGWIESEVVPQKSNPPKKVFHVTEAGRAEMEEWLRTPVEAERQIRDELLTKIYFGARVSPQELPKLIEEQIVVHQDRIEEIRANMEKEEDALTRLFMNAGLRHAQADYDWLVWMRGQLAEINQSTSTQEVPR